MSHQSQKIGCVNYARFFKSGHIYMYITYMTHEVMAHHTYMICIYLLCCGEQGIKNLAIFHIISLAMMPSFITITKFDNKVGHVHQRVQFQLFGGWRNICIDWDKPLIDVTCDTNVEVEMSLTNSEYTELRVAITQSYRSRQYTSYMLLKIASSKISLSLTLIFNASINQGQLLYDSKQANIVPVFKKGSRAYPTNY